MCKSNSRIQVHVHTNNEVTIHRAKALKLHTLVGNLVPSYYTCVHTYHIIKGIF